MLKQLTFLTRAHPHPTPYPLHTHSTTKPPTHTPTPTPTHPPKPPTIYNHLLTYHSKQISLNFSIPGPYHKFLDQGRLAIRTYRGLVVQCIEPQDRYVRGASYFKYQLGVGAVGRFIDWGGAGEFFDGGERSWVRIYPEQAQQSQQPQQSQHQPPPLPPKITTPTPTPSTLLLELQSSQLQASIAFKVPLHQVQVVQNLLSQSLNHIYGLDSMFDCQFEEVMGRVGSGEVEEEVVVGDVERFVL